MNAPAARLLHGFLEPCLLSLLEGQPDYGLSLAQRLEAAGLGPIPGGTLYPALLRLEKRGLVTAFRKPSTSGPARKYFELTPEGAVELTARRQEWRSFATTAGAIIEGQHARQEAPS
ncbi:PadR family transcriptional regulator [Actinomyces capricornis]|uniref:Transcriptional regulator n=1 Tax=Actinomyces capricornis TaxID=2755559 RepID=A0ABM7UH11_9ACTO|nr:PadR family transcriptional regulator [Actinomyces capricornis]BDA64183.1 transcriptional regulator [Actinomyces capricornis]